MRYQKHVLTVALSLLSAAAAAQGVPLRNLTVEQAATAQLAAPRPGSLAATITADRADATYAVGETVHLTLTVNEDAFVTVLDIGPTGQVTQLFPNKYQTDNHVVAGRPVEIAAPGTGARIVVGHDGNRTHQSHRVEQTDRRDPQSQLRAVGGFRSVNGGVKSAVRDLQVVAATPLRRKPRSPSPTMRFTRSPPARPRRTRRSSSSPLNRRRRSPRRPRRFVPPRLRP